MVRVGFRDNACPRFLATVGLKAVNGRWKVPILTLLCDGPMRYSDIRRGLDRISDKMLAQQLDLLLSDELVIRRELHSSSPKIVEYQLSGRGEAVRPVLMALIEFGRHIGTR